MHLCLWLIIKKRNKENYSVDKNLFKIRKIKAMVSCPSPSGYFFWLWIVCFFLLVISSFISRYMFLWEWRRKNLRLYTFTNCYACLFPGFLFLLPSTQSVTHYTMINTRKQKSNICTTRDFFVELRIDYLI